MELSYIFYKELPIDENNIFERNISDKIEVQNALFKKSNKYTITGLSINQDTDSLIEVTDKNRKQILQKLIENLLKEKKTSKTSTAFNVTTLKAMKKLSL